MNIPAPATIKAITIHQPWATLIIAGIKQFETRGWQTNYRGKLAIHASKNTRYIDDLLKTMYKRPYKRGVDELDAWERTIYEAMLSMSAEPEKYPAGKSVDAWFTTGVILGEVDLTAMHAERPPMLTKREEILGEYGTGRWEWQMDNPIMYPQFIPISGKQGLWNWTR